MAPETAATTIRLTDRDKANIEKIVRAGVAKDTSESIRVALAEYAQQVGSLENVMGRASFDRLVALAAIDREKFPATKLEAERELLRRGFFPDGLGNWVEDRPDLTIRVPGYQKRR